VQNNLNSLSRVCLHIVTVEKIFMLTLLSMWVPATLLVSVFEILCSPVVLQSCLVEEDVVLVVPGDGSSAGRVH
jgi:hypothetical protein